VRDLIICVELGGPRVRPRDRGHFV